MRNSAVQAMFAKQYEVPASDVDVTFITYCDGTYEFHVGVLNDAGEYEEFEFFSTCKFN